MRTKFLAAASFVAGLALAASPALFGAEAPASQWSRVPVKATCRWSSIGPAAPGQGAQRASLLQAGDHPTTLAGSNVAEWWHEIGSHNG